MGTTRPKLGLTGLLPSLFVGSLGHCCCCCPQARDFTLIHVLFSSSPLTPKHNRLLRIIVICNLPFGFGPWVLVEWAFHSSFLSPTLIILLLQTPKWVGVGGGPFLGQLAGPREGLCWGPQDASRPSRAWPYPCTSNSLALEPPTPPLQCLSFLFFSNPKNPGGGLVGTSPVRGGLRERRGTGSQESFILVVIIILTVGKWEGENQTIKTARGLIPIQASLFM